MLTLDEFREQFPITSKRAYLYSGALAPMCLPVGRATQGWCDRWSTDPEANYEAAIQEHRDLRSVFGRLIGAEPDDISLTDNTSRASNTAVRLLANRPGSNVVVDDTTYPSSLYPWMAMTRHQIRGHARPTPPI